VRVDGCEREQMAATACSEYMHVNEQASGLFNMTHTKLYFHKP